MNKHELYEISKRRVLRGRLDPELCLYNPREVYECMRTNARVRNWHRFIAKEYWPPQGKRVLLLYPCSSVKPYNLSRSYKALYRTLSSLGEARSLVHVVTVSEPFALVPEEYYDEWDVWYDCPGLFRWWCNRHGQPYEEKYVDASIEILADVVARFLGRTASVYGARIAFVRTVSAELEYSSDHTHRRILESASNISGVKIEILPDREFVERLVRERGRLAWDLQGVSHPLAQEYLLEVLRRAIESLTEK